MTTLANKYDYKEKKMIPCRGDVVWIESKTRGRFSGQKAEPNCEYYVINSWVNSYGSRKLALIDEAGEEYFTTDKCAVVRSRHAHYDETHKKWRDAHYAWMDKTYIPLIVTAVSKWGGKAPAISRERTSILVVPLGMKTEFWVSEKWMHPDDWPDLDTLKPNETLSVRIPQWLAKKNNVL